MNINILRTKNKVEFNIFNNITIISNYNYENSILHIEYILNEHRLFEFNHNIDIQEDDYHYRLVINGFSNYLRKLSNLIYKNGHNEN